MKGFLAFFVAALIIVALSAIPPEHARWIALGLIGLIVITPATGRYASADRRRGGRVSYRERGSSDSP